MKKVIKKKITTEKAPEKETKKVPEKETTKTKAVRSVKTSKEAPKETPKETPAVKTTKKPIKKKGTKTVEDKTPKQEVVAEAQEKAQEVEKRQLKAKINLPTRDDLKGSIKDILTPYKGKKVSPTMCAEIAEQLKQALVDKITVEVRQA